jgi:hypothetical protein
MTLPSATADQCRKRAAVDLGVDRGDLAAAVAQHLTDVAQA